MQRTQIYLDEIEVAALEAASARTGANRSELIRRAIRAQYGSLGPGDRLDALRSSAGAWRGRAQSGAEYVDAVRADVNERLSRLGHR